MKKTTRSSSLSPLELVDDLKKIISESDNQYKKALLRLAIEKENNIKRIFFGRIDFIFKDDSIPESIIHDYGNFILTQISIDVKDIPSMFENLHEGKPITVNSIDNIICNFEREVRWDNQQKPSNESWGYLKSNYPAMCYSSRLERSNNRTFPEILAGKNTDPYPNTAYAVIDFLNLHRRDEWGMYLNDNSFLIIIPDFRLKIKKMKIIRNKIRVELEYNLLNENDIFAQFYIDGDKKVEVPIKNNLIEVDSSKNPQDILAVVLDKKTDEILDYKHYDFRYSEIDPSVEIETHEDIVREWVTRGENDFVEFKEVLKHEDDVMKTVVAFANTNGGRILLGVKDDCSIVGYEEQLENTKNRLERMIASKCDPPINFEMEQVDLGKKITVIKIPKGTSKIYSVTNGPIYVRRGGSDRFIKPSELFEIFERKKQ